MDWVSGRELRLLCACRCSMPSALRMRWPQKSPCHITHKCLAYSESLDFMVHISHHFLKKNSLRKQTLGLNPKRKKKAVLFKRKNFNVNRTNTCKIYLFYRLPHTLPPWKNGLFLVIGPCPAVVVSGARLGTVRPTTGTNWTAGGFCVFFFFRIVYNSPVCVPHNSAI